MAFQVASGAFNTIKKGLLIGREIESMAGDLKLWMGAVSDIKKAEYNKKPLCLKSYLMLVLLKKRFMEIFMAKKLLKI